MDQNRLHIQIPQNLYCQIYQHPNLQNIQEGQEGERGRLQVKPLTDTKLLNSSCKEPGRFRPTMYSVECVCACLCAGETATQSMCLDIADIHPGSGAHIYNQQHIRQLVDIASIPTGHIYKGVQYHRHMMILTYVCEETCKYHVFYLYFSILFSMGGCIQMYFKIIMNLES